MIKKAMLKGLSQLDLKEDIVYTRSKFGKNHQLLYKESTYKNKTLFELIHSDVFALVKQTSINGFRYMITFIDDLSG